MIAFNQLPYTNIQDDSQVEYQDKGCYFVRKSSRSGWTFVWKSHTIERLRIVRDNETDEWCAGEDMAVYQTLRGLLDKEGEDWICPLSVSDINKVYKRVSFLPN